MSEQQLVPADGHVHTWTGWRKPIVVCDSFGTPLDLGHQIYGEIYGGRPITPGFRRICRGCGASEET